MPRYYLVIFFLPLLFLQSCIENEEEIWIEGDGSGKLRIDLILPPLAKAKIGNPKSFVAILQEIDAEEDSIKIHELSFGKEAKGLVFHLEASFDDALKLEEIAARHEDRFLDETGADTDQLSSVIGIITMGIDGLNPTFERVISLGSVIPRSTKAMPALLGNSYSKYIIHLPAKVKETNAHEVSEDGKTITWTFLLKDHTETPMVMTLKSGLPIPWWSWVVLALSGALAFRFLMKKIRRK